MAHLCESCTRDLGPCPGVRHKSSVGCIFAELQTTRGQPQEQVRKFSNTPMLAQETPFPEGFVFSKRTGADGEHSSAGLIAEEGEQQVTLQVIEAPPEYRIVMGAKAHPEFPLARQTDLCEWHFGPTRWQTAIAMRRAK